MSAPQTPERCPTWCARLHTSTVTRLSHCTANFAAQGSGAYVVVIQHPDTQPDVLISTLDDAPLLHLDSGTARMLATITIEPVAKALRKAADELDRITPGGDS